jgi:hypothetical protein
MSSPRETFMAAAAASLAAMWPERHVLRGLQDPAVLGDQRLRHGVYALVAEGTEGWAEYTGREGTHGTLDFSVIAWVRVEDLETTEDLERAESEMEAEILAWCQARKLPPLDAVYPKRVTYSGGLEHPVGWLVMRCEALYI